jgi:hypothetical protein
MDNNILLLVLSLISFLSHCSNLSGYIYIYFILLENVWVCSRNCALVGGSLKKQILMESWTFAHQYVSPFIFDGAI